MSVKTALMKAFGFQPSDVDDEDEATEYVSALPPARPTAANALPDTIQPVDEEQPADEPLEMSSPEFPTTVFDSLLQVFNEAQPDFIRKCLDIDAQRRYLYDSMDASFKAYIQQLQSEALSFAEKKCSAMLHSHSAEMQQLREKLAAAEKRLDEQKQQTMSATRQKRAMNDRLRDLEQQVEAAQAEKDQYALETKSLLNKLKVAQVRGGETSEITETDKDAEQYKTAAAEANRQVSLLNAQAVAKQNEIDNLSTKLKTITERAEKAEKEVLELTAQLELTRKLCSDAEQRAEQAETRIASLETQPATTEQKTEQEPDVESTPRKQRRRKKPKHTISAIDASLDTTEWLLPTPPAGQTKTQIVSDAEFGYHEPQRDDPPLNDAQLSLFD